MSVSGPCAIASLGRSQQKWEPVLRPIAPYSIKAHDSIAKPLTLWRITREGGGPELLFR
jgi:hypothetical protein